MSSINILAMSDECNLEQLCYPAGIMLKIEVELTIFTTVRS